MSDTGAEATPADPRVVGDDDPRAPLRAVGAFVAVAAAVLLGLNLRLVFGSASSVLAEIRRAYGLGSGSAALLTTGPVLCLGVFGPLAARAVRRWTVPAVLTGCLALVAVGTALRGVPLWVALLLGTLLAGIGIAVANVLGPVLVRLLFPHRIGVLTGLLTALVSASAGIASGITVPVEHGLLHSWRASLAAWAVPAVLAVLALALVAGRYRRFRGAQVRPGRADPGWRQEVLRSPVAWGITGFMGIQSLLAYAMIGWLPTIYREQGLGAEQAGLLLTVLSVSSIATALVCPMLATRLRGQRALAVAVVACSALGLCGVLTAALEAPAFWAVLLGLGQGGQLSLALTLVNLRASCAAIATSLSTMAQSVGYVIAALGPIVVGALRGVTGSWTVALVVLLALMVPLSLCGWFAGRGNRWVSAAPSEPTATPSEQATTPDMPGAARRRHADRGE